MKKNPQRKPPKKPEPEHDLIDLKVEVLDEDTEEIDEHECPICRAPMIGKKPFCLKCGSKLSERKNEEKDKIVNYFNYIQSIMERSMEAIGKSKKDDIISKWSDIDYEIKKNPWDGDLWFQKGMILNGLGAFDTALSAFDELLDIDKNNTKAWIAKAFVLEKQKKYREASKCYRSGLDSILKASPEEIQQKATALSKEQISLVSTKSKKGLEIGKGLTNGLTNGLVNDLTNGMRRKRLDYNKGLTNGLVNGLTNGRHRSKQGMINGLTNGRVNGLTNGRIKSRRGLTNGLTNGAMRRRGFTNGLTNGLVNGSIRRRGLTNGMTNGLKRSRLGLSNGVINGLTNGITNGVTNGLKALRTGITNGITNGNGIVNGLGKVPGTLGTKKRKAKFIVVPIIVLIIILFPQILNMLRAPPEGGVNIDGDFSDWEGIEPNTDIQEGIVFNPNVDIIAYRVYKEKGLLSLYLEVEGNMMEGQPAGFGRNMDTAYIFLDKDQEYSSGYQIRGIGADYMAKIEGWQGKIYYQNLYSYTSDAQDWNLWQKAGSVSAAAAGSELEIQISYSALNFHNHETVDVLFYMQSWDNFDDYSDTIIGSEKGILKIKQFSVGEDAISGYGNRLLRLDLEALNSDISLSELIAKRTGEGSDSDVSAIRLTDEIGNSVAVGTMSYGQVTFHPDLLFSGGQTRVLYIVVDVSGNAVAGNTIGFKIATNHDVVTNKGTISLESLQTTIGLNDNSYIGAVPTEIKVDGAFADWDGKDMRDDTVGDVDKKNLDIIEYSIYNTTQMVSFYLRVDGEIGLGTAVPFWNDANAPEPSKPIEPVEPGPPTPSAPMAPTPPPRTGEDITYIYIDSDNSSTTGYSIGKIGADYLIDIKGKYGEVTSKKFMSFVGSSSSEWKWFDENTIDAETDTSRLETQIDKNRLGITGHFKVYFQTTDWSESEEDYSTEEISRGIPILILRGTRYTGDTLVCKTGTTPTIDGDYQAGEWSDANSVTNGDLTVYAKMDETNVYFAVTTADTSEDINDICAIYFETDHANDGVDDSYDKKLQTRYVGIWFDEWFEGTASGWPGVGEAPPPANHIIAENLESGVGMEYEAQIPKSTLNDAGEFDEDHEKIGFAVRVINAGATYEEWPDGATDEPSGDSNSWGELEIPEFKEVVMPISCTVVLYLFWRRRKNGQNMENNYRMRTTN